MISASYYQIYAFDRVEVGANSPMETPIKRAKVDIMIMLRLFAEIYFRVVRLKKLMVKLRIFIILS